jgi:ferric iron reductase protein FhuF
VLAWTVNELRALVDERTLVPARSLLASRYWTDGTLNPLFLPARGAGRSRRVCCLGYRLDGLDYCLDCPISCKA